MIISLITETYIVTFIHFVTLLFVRMCEISYCFRITAQMFEKEDEEFESSSIIFPPLIVSTLKKDK